MTFENAHPALAGALAARDYSEPTPVQAAVLEPGAAARDLVVSAQTGSGKTVAYGLALAPTLIGEAERFGPAGEPLALVVAPTRELALQVQREFEWLYAPAGARVISLVGGMDIRRERRALAEGCHIVVGTPGRLRDHLEKGHFDPTHLAAVVLDEADEMLDLGFRDDLEFILDTTPEGRRTLLFSATMPKPIVELARTYQRDALRIDVAKGSEAHADIDYRAIRVAPNDVERTVVNLLRFYEAPAAMVFCNTRESVRHLYGSLTERGFAAVALSGELSQSDRTTALQSIRDGRARICVATDVAARGIDVPDLGLVIHADLPNDAETLLHRSGRTGRAGRKGTCVMVVPYTRRRKAEFLVRDARVQVTWVAPPSADDIRALDQKRLLADPILTEGQSEEDLALGRALLEGRSAEEIAAALVRLYHARLPEPEEIFDAGPQASEREGRGTRDRGERFDRGDRFSASEGRGEREPGPPRLAPGEAVWFRMSVGRNKNADPRWLLPLICRIGHVTKRDIGTIRILDRETRFEIALASAERFAAAVRRAVDEEVQIEPVAGEAAPRDVRPDAFRKPTSRPPRGDRPVRVAGPEGKPPARPGKRERVRAARRAETYQAD